MDDHCSIHIFLETYIKPDTGITNSPAANVKQNPRYQFMVAA